MQKRLGMEAVHFRGTTIDELWLDAGSGWRDQTTGCWISACTPAAEPDRWDQYLKGALQSYRRYGVECALDVDAIRDGADTALFFAALDTTGRVVGGTRVVGPLRSAEESHALVEWDGNRGLDALRRMIDNRLAFGVAEVKGAWANSREYGSRALAKALARTALPTMTLLGVQFVMATAAAHVLEQWSSSGGVVATQVPAAAYPSEKYRTKLMWWDRHALVTHAEPEQFKLMCAENSELLRRVSASCELRSLPIAAGA
jgi:hypothetical protein